MNGARRTALRDDDFAVVMVHGATVIDGTGAPPPPNGPG